MTLNRRRFTQALSLGAGALALSTPGLRAQATAAAAKPEQADVWQALLGTSLDREYDYQATVEGNIPGSLQGTLYRNGPGLFERDGFRKSTLLDGDGMLQAIDIHGQNVRYRNHFVRTDKYIAEEQAGKFLMPTWTTPAPGFFDNIPGIPGGSQAGVTTYVVNGQLYAIDEAGEPWVLDPKTLDGDREQAVVENDPAGSYKAHTKFDAKTGDWIFLGWTPGRHTDIDVIIKHAAGGLKSRRRFRSPRGGYIHDFFNSENHIVVLLHAVSSNPFPMLAGLETFSESLSWQPELGNIVLVIPKDISLPVREYEAPPSWMWHSFNAYEQGNELIVDFIGYEEPDHFLGPNATLRTIMQGRLGDSHYPGIARRYRMDLQGSSLVEEQLAEGNFEFPMIHGDLSGQPHSHGFATTGAQGQFFHSGLAAIDFRTGKVESFDFGPEVHVGEAIFVPEGADEKRGYLLTMCLDGSSGKSFIAILNAAQLDDGPVARIMLSHHTPLSFHGFWQAA